MYASRDAAKVLSALRDTGGEWRSIGHQRLAGAAVAREHRPIKIVAVRRGM